jgi:hypothetical protein
MRSVEVAGHIFAGWKEHFKMRMPLFSHSPPPPPEVPDRFPQEAPDRLPEEEPFINPDEMPEHLPEEMPDRFPEEMPPYPAPDEQLHA